MKGNFERRYDHVFSPAFFERLLSYLKRKVSEGGEKEGIARKLLYKIESYCYMNEDGDYEIKFFGNELDDLLYVCLSDAVENGKKKEKKEEEKKCGFIKSFVRKFVKRT